jgi:PhnB protein
LGAKIETLVRFGDVPGSAAGASEQIMHAALRIGDTIVLASDGGRDNDSRVSGFSIALQVAQDGEAERLFAALAEGGAVEVPLMSTPFSSRFGKLTDRFGIPWIIVIQQRSVES